MTSFRWGAATDIGRVRQNNQDAVLVEDGLFLVADGMGGHRGGEVASAIAVEQIKEHFTEQTTDTFVEAVQEANRAVVQRADDEPELRGMGTTVTGLALVQDEGEDRLGIVNVGDSRLYLLKGPEGLEQITEDHSLVATLERQGQLTKDEAAVHPHRNILTRALGIDQMVLVDSWEILPFPGDRYILCSDGLFNEVTEDEIAQTLGRNEDPEAAANELVALANEGGGRDNITVLIVDVVADDDEEVAPADPGVERVTKATHASERVLLTPEVQGGGAPPPPGEAAVPSARGPLTWRVVGFVVVVFIVLGVGVFAVGTIANNTFYVGSDAGEVVIYRGRPGGVLWMQPSIEERTGIDVADVPEPYRSDIDEGKDEPSLEEARAYVTNVRNEVGTQEDLGAALGGDLGTSSGGDDPVDDPGPDPSDPDADLNQ